MDRHAAAAAAQKEKAPGGCRALLKPKRKND